MGTITNMSGKFISSNVSHATSMSQKAEKGYSSSIPEVPAFPALVVEHSPAVTTRSYMDDVRMLFGKLWWLWLVVIVWWLMKR